MGATPIVATACKGDADYDYSISDLKWSRVPHADAESTLDSYVIKKNGQKIDPNSIESLKAASDCSQELFFYRDKKGVYSITPAKSGKFKLSLIVELKNGDEFKVSTDIIVQDHSWYDNYYYIQDGWVWVRKICYDCKWTEDEKLYELDSDHDIVITPSITQTATEALDDELAKISEESRDDYRIYLPEDDTINFGELQNLGNAKNLVFCGREGSKVMGTATIKENNTNLIFNCVTFSDYTKFVGNFTSLKELGFYNSIIYDNSNICVDNYEAEIGSLVVKGCEFGKIDDTQFEKTTKKHEDTRYWSSLIVRTQVDTLTVTDSVFKGAIYNAIQSDPGVNDSLVITNNVFENTQNRAIRVLSSEDARYTIENNTYKNCNPYETEPAKYKSNTYWIAHPNELVAIGGRDAYGTIQEQTIKESQFNNANLSNNILIHNDGEETVIEFEFITGQTGENSGFKNKAA